MLYRPLCDTLLFLGSYLFLFFFQQYCINKFFFFLKKKIKKKKTKGVGHSNKDHIVKIINKKKKKKGVGQINGMAPGQKEQLEIAIFKIV
jgi:hypothetical protein